MDKQPIAQDHKSDLQHQFVNSKIDKIAEQHSKDIKEVSSKLDSFIQETRKSNESNSCLGWATLIVAILTLIATIIFGFFK